MRTACGALIVAMLALALAACGESKEDKALSSVCDARADIGKQVDTLKGLTPSTVTTDAVKKSLDAIKKDLQDIADARSDLSSDRRSEVDAANKTFKSSIQQIAGEIGTSVSASDAKAGVVTALQQLGASYEKAYAPLNCD